MPNSNTFYKIVSLVIAIALWAYVMVNEDPMKKQTIPDVPVQLLNVENLTAKGYALSGEINFTVDVVVEGRRADLAKISSNDFTASADLYGYSIGKNYIPVVISAPDGITVENRTEKIVVNIEELVAVAKDVKVAFIGQFENGVEAGQIVTQPEQVEVSGAKSEVSAVAFIKAEVSASKLTAEGSTIQAKAVAVNNSGDVVDNVRLSSSYIDVSARLYRVKEIPLRVEILGQVAPIYEVTNLQVPSSVKIKGPQELIAGISEVAASPVDISQVVSTSKLPLEIGLPDGVELASGYENIAVDITIKPVATKQFTYTADEIMIEGLEEEANISITTPQITVVASGSEAVIAGLKKEDLEPYIDLDTASLLSATAKVLVRYDKQLGHIAVDPEEVHIMLNQTEGD